MTCPIRSCHRRLEDLTKTIGSHQLYHRKRGSIRIHIGDVIRPPGERCESQGHVIALHQNTSPVRMRCHSVLALTSCQEQRKSNRLPHVPTHSSTNRSRPPVSADKLAKKGDYPCRLSDVLQRDNTPTHADQVRHSDRSP